MFDQTAIADNVTRWTGLGIDLPESLAGAIETFEALRYTEVGYQPTFDLSEVTATNAEDKLREFADELALSESPAGKQSVLERAKGYAVADAARQVLRAARAAVPVIIDHLAPEFDQHAAAYEAAVDDLPEDVTAEALLKAGTGAVAAYADAQREAAYLNGVSGWVASTAWLSGAVPQNVDPTLRILRPAIPLELIKLDEAQQKQANPTLDAINPVLFAAVRLGVEFGINTIEESTDIRRGLESLTVSQNVSRW